MKFGRGLMTLLINGRAVGAYECTRLTLELANEFVGPPLPPAFVRWNEVTVTLDSYNPLALRIEYPYHRPAKTRRTAQWKQEREKRRY